MLGVDRRKAFDQESLQALRLKDQLFKIKMNQLQVVEQLTYQEMLQEINTRFRTKEQLYKYLQTKTLLFLPRKGYCTLNFLHQLLLEQKVIQLQKEVPQDPNVPNWPELAVRKIWPQAIQLPGVLERLPDEWTGNIRTDRNFFYATIMGLHNDWLAAVINDCAQQRKARLQTRQLPRQVIQINADIARKLIAHEHDIRGNRQPVRGAGIFAARRQRAYVRGVQPPAIQPNFRLQEYIQRYEQQLNNQSNQNFGGSQNDDYGDEDDQGDIIDNQNAIRQPFIPNSQPVQRPPLGRPPRLSRSNSIGGQTNQSHLSFRSHVPPVNPMQQFAPALLQNSTQQIGSRGNILHFDTLNRVNDAIAEEQNEQDGNVADFQDDMNRSVELPAHLRDPNFNRPLSQSQQPDHKSEDNDEG